MDKKEEMLGFVSAQIDLGMFVGLNTQEVDGVIVYTVDYWENETTTNQAGEEVEIKAGKQKLFTL